MLTDRCRSSGMSLGETGGKNAPGTAQLNLFQSIDDLVKVKHEMCAIGDEHSATTVQTCLDKLNYKIDVISIYIPSRSNASSSAKKDGKCTTTPDPITPVHPGFTSPISHETLSYRWLVIRRTRTCHWGANGMQRSSGPSPDRWGRQSYVQRCCRLRSARRHLPPRRGCRPASLYPHHPIERQARL